MFGIGGAAGWMERKGTCLGRCEAGALLDAPAGVSWDQSEDPLEIFVGSGITLCGSVPWDFAFGGQSLLPLQSCS